MHFRFSAPVPVARLIAVLVRSFAPLAAAWLAVAPFAVGCAGAGANDASHRALSPYGGHAAELFDDAIEPRAVGLDVSQSALSARTDPVLRERAQLADAVLVVSVGTVTSKNEESGSSYTLDLRTVEKLMGDHPPSELFSVTVPRRSASVGLVRSLESRLVGKSFVIFVRAFANSDEPELHFHVVSNSKDQIAAIRDAAALAEIK